VWITFPRLLFSGNWLGVEHLWPLIHKSWYFPDCATTLSVNGKSEKDLMRLPHKGYRKCWPLQRGCTDLEHAGKEKLRWRIADLKVTVKMHVYVWVHAYVMTWCVSDVSCSHQPAPVSEATTSKKDTTATTDTKLHKHKKRKRKEDR